MPSDDAPLTTTARFSDGKSAAGASVEVRLAPRGLEIVRAGEPGPLVWPYLALAVAVPLSRASTDALVTYSYMPGATLFIADGAFVGALAQAAPHLSTRAHRWSAARPWLAVAATLVLVAVGVWLAGLSPARTVAELLPAGVRQALGDQVVVSIVGGKPKCVAPAGLAALDTLGKRLLTKDGGLRTFEIAVVDLNIVNAFAAPGERIVITHELIQRAASPDEVAGVLAHEMGHGLELHPETALVRALGLSAVLDLVFAGGGGTIANLGAMLAQLSYTRAAEEEADGHALRLLRQAGISPLGMRDFFQRMERIERDKGGGPAGSTFSLFRTHPNSVERAKRAEAAANYGATPALTSAEWAALRSICAMKGSLASPRG